MRELVEKAFEKAVSILKEKRAILEKAAKELLQKETLSADDLARLVGQSPRRGTDIAVAPSQVLPPTDASLPG